MIKSIINLFAVKPVVLDGALYVMIATLGVMEATFSSEDSYKYVNIYVIFWLKHILGWGLAAVSALAMFRNKAYGEHVKAQQEKKALEDGNTTVITETKESKTNEIKINPPQSPTT